MKSLKIKTLAMTAMLLLTAASCSKEQKIETPDTEEQEIETSDTEEHYITAYQAGTRVGYDKNGAAYWHYGDQIGLLADSKLEDGVYFNNVFTLADGGGTSKATFYGKGAITSYATYPYNEKNYLAFERLYYYFPDTYTLTSVNTHQTWENGNGNSFNMPMLGTISTEDGQAVVRFKNIGAVVCIYVDDLPTAAGTLTVTSAENNLAGCIYTDTDSPELKNTNIATKLTNTVTFNYTGANRGNDGHFYLPVATGTYSLTISLRSDSDMDYACSIAEKDQTFTIEKGHIKFLRVTCTTNTVKQSDGSYLINGHKFIDLGLCTGTLWAETNMGASSSSDWGDYYAWGDVTANSGTPSWEDYRWSSDDTGDNLTKYNATDGRTVLEHEDDPAYVGWGNCKTPSYEDFQELLSECNWEWTTVDHHNGYKVSSKTNGNSIFLPASGDYYIEVTYDPDLSWGRDEYCIYWTTRLNESNPQFAYSTLFYQDGGNVLNWNSFDGNKKYNPSRQNGASIRPVVRL